MRVAVDTKRITLSNQERKKVVKHLSLFSPDYSDGGDGEAIFYGEGYEELSDKDALRDLNQWILNAKKAGKFLKSLGFDNPLDEE